MFLGFEERFQKIGEIEKEGGTLGFGANERLQVLEFEI